MSNVLDEFLVLLGWKPDEASARKAEATADRVADTVEAAEHRQTEAAVAGAAKRKIEADREAGRRTKGAAEHIADHNRRRDAEKKTASEAEAAARVKAKSAREQTAAEVKAAKAAEDRRASFVSGLNAMVLAAEAAALGVTAAIVKISSGMEDLFYASQRTKSSVGSLKAIGFAASQAGSSAGQALGSLEALATRMRESPGWEGMLKSLGVASERNGKPLELTDRLLELGDVLKKMPQHQQLAYGRALGIDDNTLRALTSGEMRQQIARYREMTAQAGLDPDKAAASSKEFMTVWRELLASLEIVVTRIQTTLLEKFGGSVKKATEALLKNAGRIADISIKVAEAIWRFVSRALDLVDAFQKLDPATKDMALSFGVLAGALMLLKSGPLGVLLAVGSAILALYDDYRKWKDGSRDTLINWGEWEPKIKAAIEGIKTLAIWFDKVAKSLTGQDGLTVAFEMFAVYLAGRWLTSVLGTFGKFKLGWLAIAGIIANDLAKNSTPEGRADTVRELEESMARVQNGPSGWERGWLGKGWNAIRNGAGKIFGMGAEAHEGDPSKSLKGKFGDSGGITGPIPDPPTDADRAEVRNYARAKAAEMGIDPNVLDRVMKQESRFDRNAQNINAREESYGPMQLNMKGGLGAEALRQGVNPRDPSTWKQQIDFALGVVKKDGWRQWYGARDVGISRWQGIGGRYTEEGAQAASSVAPTKGVGGVNQQQGPGNLRPNPITAELRDQLAYAGTQAGVNTDVYSGGQDPDHQHGSDRHNNGRSADVRLYVTDENGKKRYLSSNNAADRAKMADFMRHGAQAGVTGIGHGPGYMGDTGIHMGGGSSIAWGAGGRAANAPDWVREAHRQGTAARERAHVDMEAWKKSQQDSAKPKPDSGDYSAYRREMEERAAKGELPGEGENDADRYAKWRKGKGLDGTAGKVSAVIDKALAATTRLQASIETFPSDWLSKAETGLERARGAIENVDMDGIRRATAGGGAPISRVAENHVVNNTYNEGARTTTISGVSDPKEAVGHYDQSEKRRRSELIGNFQNRFA